MSTLLRIDSSPRPGSVTRALTGAFADDWAAARPDARVIHHDLPALDLPHLGVTELGAWFAAPGERTDLHDLVLGRSDRLVDDLLGADELVIGAPMWNFSIPSNLKAWIDHVVRLGRTIEYGSTQPYGLVGARRAVVITSRGSDFRVDGLNAALDFQEPYLRTVLGFLGVTDVRFVHADHQGPNWPDGDAVVAEAEATVRRLAREVPAEVGSAA